jgi:hypothetical protein
MKLRVQQTIAADAQARDEVHEGDLACVARGAEHALAEEGGAERDAVEPAHQRVARPALHAVRLPPQEELAVEGLDRRVDPGVGAVGADARALGDDLLEGGVDADLERIATHRAGEPARDVQIVQREDSPALGVDQEDALVVPAVGHREDAVAVAGDEVLRGELHEFAVPHCAGLMAAASCLGGDPLLEPVDVVVAGQYVALGEQVLEQRDGGLDAADDHLAERAAQARDALGAVAPVHDQLASQAVVVGRDHVARVERAIEPNA